MDAELYPRRGDDGQVTEFAYVGIGVSDLVAWRDYATGVAGMEARDRGTDHVQLRMDAWHHRIDVRRDSSDDIQYMGWRVADETSLEALKERLVRAGVSFEEGTEDDAEARNVLGLIRLKDPAGFDAEIFYGPEIENHRPFHPGRPLHGRFATGEQGLGHCFLTQPDAGAALHFYRLLGLRGGVQYKFEKPGEPDKRPIFMQCNSRQHTVSFGQGYQGRRRVNHLMFEYTSLDDLGMALDIVNERKIPLVRALGRHSNDGAVSFYFGNPSGWLWELGWNGRETPTQSEYYRGDYYGHQTLVKGYGL